ncbi:lipid carrier--UDP-N-acetylgalactosaminyltransferase [Bradyrhizobium brasilense]|nr:lipid carrier--UDP-N-acetylgalactosaminyltransferase [Bradyrhizobium brasilense]
MSLAQPIQFAIKRTLDAAASALLLALLWPVLLIVAAAIRIESRGPAIFKQVRIGRSGRTFVCYKFRSMFLGTADIPTHQVSRSSITGLGRQLRRYKLDELPQLLNVLRGDMSLVGPRPCLATQLDLIQARKRLGIFAVRPGITGIAQIRGIDMSDPDRLADADARYVQNFTMMGDLKIIWATLCGNGLGIDQAFRA